MVFLFDKNNFFAYYIIKFINIIGGSFMQIKTFKTYHDLSLQISREISEVIIQKPDAHLCIAAGHTSLGIFKELQKQFDLGVISFSQCHFTAMDEWLGMNDTTPGSCGNFLRNNFLSLVDFQEKNIALFNGKSVNPQMECHRMKDVLESLPPFDYLLLGVGMNGHLALNEPGSNFHDSVHITQLDSITQKVGQKYFDSRKETALTGGITIGIGDMAKAKRIVLAINGSAKRDILQLIIKTPVSDQLPATVLKSWPQASIYCDRSAQ